MKGDSKMRTSKKQKVVKKPTVTMIPVKSSHVLALGHKSEIESKSETMFVQYHADKETKTVYAFDGVTKEMFDEIMKSESIGKAIHATKIKGKKVE